MAPGEGTGKTGGWAAIYEVLEIAQAFQRASDARMAESRRVAANAGAVGSLALLGVSVVRGVPLRLLQTSFSFGMFCLLPSLPSLRSRLPTKWQTHILTLALLHLFSLVVLVLEDLSDPSGVARTCPTVTTGVLAQGGVCGIIYCFLMCVVLLAGLPPGWNLAYIHLAIPAYGMLNSDSPQVEESRGPSSCLRWSALLPLVDMYLFAWLVLAVRHLLDGRERHLFALTQAEEPSEAEDVPVPEDVLAVPADVASSVMECDGEKEEVRNKAAPKPPLTVVRKLSEKSTKGSELSPKAHEAKPNALLMASMSSPADNQTRLREMCEKMWDADYTLEEYFTDCTETFPELQLFFVAAGSSSSGVSNELEYQRTIGSLFTVYWLLRLNLDGCLGFCYGVDNNWKPIRPPKKLRKASKFMSGCSDISEKVSCPFSQMDESQKRASFHDTMQWALFADLISQASCCKASFMEDGPERLMALLTITAIHDIMKVEALLPVVQPEHSPYMGYNSGVVIRDHDIAIGYVMTHYPNLLPSYAALPPSAQAVCLFSQGKMNFNHGWFVQAEAPAGGMLRTLKSVLKEEESCAPDIAFYFLHWLTDLAGAAATPRGGAEKFVLLFPQMLLASFLWSIPFLAKLSTGSETEVMELYLKARWREMLPDRPVPTTPSAIALMRLLVMTQSDGKVVDCFYDLPGMSRWTLTAELSRAGCQKQGFSMCKPDSMGPAFMVYYGPALMQQNKESTRLTLLALRLLAEVYRVARVLWPVAFDQDGVVVTIQVAELKTKTADVVIEMGMEAKSEENKEAEDGEIVDCDCAGWYIVRHNDLEGSVKWLTPEEREELTGTRVFGSSQSAGSRCALEPLDIGSMSECLTRATISPQARRAITCTLESLPSMQVKLSNGGRSSGQVSNGSSLDLEDSEDDNFDSSADVRIMRRTSQLDVMKSLSHVSRRSYATDGSRRTSGVGTPTGNSSCSIETPRPWIAPGPAPSLCNLRRVSHTEPNLPFFDSVDGVGGGTTHLAVDSGTTAQLRQENWLLRNTNQSLLQEINELRVDSIFSQKLRMQVEGDSKLSLATTLRGTQLEQTNTLSSMPVFKQSKGPSVREVMCRRLSDKLPPIPRKATGSCGNSAVGGLSRRAQAAD